MPTPTARQQAADALYQAFLVNLIANAEAEAWAQDDEDSDSDSDNLSTAFTWDSSSSSSSADDDPAPAENYLHAMADLYSQRYLAERRDIPKTRRLLDLILTDYKHDFPDIFRSYLRIDPDCFDAVVEAIRDDEVFYNDSNNPQMPVEEQLAIALYRFGHFGNAASTMKVALQFGLGYGTIHLVTTRVMKATCTERFRAASVQWASPAAKETAKEWVGNTACPAWQNGWLMVDGTLGPLFRRPGHFGNVWFDRKSNYSLNVQLISTPDLQIIDYGIGLPGSQHDASAWLETRIPQQHDVLLEPDEWVWADSAYPLQKWCQSPYTKPEKSSEENTKYNYHLSAVRIRSEHCVGFLKGRWSSLRGLRIAINNDKGVQYASLWIMACINLHAFAIRHENSDQFSVDNFYRDGRKYQKKQKNLERRWRRERRRQNREEENRRDGQNDIDLLEGKIKREELKEALFEYINEA